MLYILYIEDNELYSAVVQLVLTAEGVIVESAKTLVEAEKRLKDLTLPSFDVLLVNLCPLDAGNLKIVTALRVYNIPIVVLSTVSERDTFERAAEVGADDYIIKGPIDSAAFLRRMRFACRRYAKQRQMVAGAVSTGASNRLPFVRRLSAETFEMLKPFITRGGLSV